MTKTNLLPCPFCGGEANYHMSISRHPEHDYWHGVFCLTCPACIDNFDTEVEAIEAWNTRAERTCHKGSGWYCEECEQTCRRLRMNYCPNCGAVMER